MKLQELNQIIKSYFGYEEISRVFKISPDSAKVSAARYVRQGLLLRIKKNMYVLKDSGNRAGIALIWNLCSERALKYLY